MGLFPLQTDLWTPLEGCCDVQSRVWDLGGKASCLEMNTRWGSPGQWWSHFTITDWASPVSTVCSAGEQLWMSTFTECSSPLVRDEGGRDNEQVNTQQTASDGGLYCGKQIMYHWQEAWGPGPFWVHNSDHTPGARGKWKRTMTN